MRSCGSRQVVFTIPCTLRVTRMSTTCSAMRSEILQQCAAGDAPGGLIWRRQRSLHDLRIGYIDDLLPVRNDVDDCKSLTDLCTLDGLLLHDFLWHDLYHLHDIMGTWCFFPCVFLFLSTLVRCARDVRRWFLCFPIVRVSVFMSCGDQLTLCWVFFNSAGDLKLRAVCTQPTPTISPSASASQAWRCRPSQAESGGMQSPENMRSCQGKRVQ